MIARYVASLAATVVLTTLFCSTLRFATRSQVLSGKAVEESWKLFFTIDADSSHMYEIDGRLKKSLEEGITFVAEGPVRVDSSSFVITPQEITWTENRTRKTAPGAVLAVQVKWETPADSPDGAHGFIYASLPILPGSFSIHSGDFSWDNKRLVLREVTTNRSSSSLFFARFGFALAAGLPLGIVLHSIGWGFLLSREKKSRIAALPPQGSQIPRTFYPNPIAEWSTWTFVLAIAGVLGCLLVFLSGDFLSSSMIWFIYIALAVGAVIALICTYFTGRSLMTVRIDADSISYARGRGDLQWVMARWADVLQATQKSRTYRGTRREWVEIEFRDKKKKLKLSENIMGYPALRDFIFSLFAQRSSA
jgi:hypothetical protein